jgi:DNA mismatch endonuclease (patch repair protein)
MSSKQSPRPAGVYSAARDGFILWIDEATSQRMARIRRKGTSPELIVRQLVSAIGQRYRVANRDLPGSPDLANRSRAWAVFVHGCFWHRHPRCRLTTTPKRNAPFWRAKFQRNGDRESAAGLRRLGYRVLIVWECETRIPAELGGRIARWFSEMSTVAPAR